MSIYPIWKKWYLRDKTPWKVIKNFFRSIKYSWQRIQNGYATSDTWSIDMWFENIMPHMLIEYRDNLCGCPCGMTTYQWRKVLDRMIYLLNEMTEDTCSRKNPYWDDDKIDVKLHDDKRWMNEEEAISKYREQCKDEFFHLFSKWFWYLWD